MNDDSEDVQRWIRLKRYESPGEGYYESFLQDFKERQRSEMLRQSARGLLFERVAMWLEESGGAKRLVPAGALAAAALGAGLYYFAGAAGTPEGGATYAGAPAGEAQVPPAATASVVAEDRPADEEAIHLHLPRPAVRVPDLADESQLDAKVLSAGIRGGLREL